MLEKIRNIICEFVDIEPEEITESSILRTDIGLNSLDCVTLVQEVEMQYDLSIPNKALMSFKTVGDIINYIETEK